jgi:ectoine hydroxylase-related dioxygenase (phytanoyl-CoA dioxygenase family)
LVAIRFGDSLGAWGGRLSVSTVSPLPVATSDIRAADRDFDEFGYCIVKDALSSGELARLRARLIDQAQGEADVGVATFDGGAHGPNQRIWHLINKGREFHDLLLNPVIDQLARPRLHQNYMVSSFSANIAGPGGEPMVLHYDQQQQQPSLPFISQITMLWFLDDVSEANGGTRLIPRSHSLGFRPATPYSIENTVAAEGPAGSVLMMDGRLWHGTGPNRTQAKRHVVLTSFCRYYLRTIENHFLAMAPGVEESLDDQVRTLLGYRCTWRVGGVESLVEGQMASRPAKPIGRLEPSQRA